ncbi:hypothetical protein ABPG75_005226 [Micractinium tetrahymenae]
MRSLGPAALFWAAWGALAALLLHRLARDALLLRRPACDTTYIYEGYEPVQLAGGGRYRLIKFADGDRDAAAARARLLRQRGAPLLELPVLFVHGHLGSHQQMRSAAAETGRELARRAAADPAGWPLWLQWYAADFNAEALALDSSLLAEQASFVLRCIDHLHRQHAAVAALAAAGSQPEGWQPQTQQQRPFRLVLVAYSMGGLVARQVVRQLAADPAFDMGQLVAVITLGSPDHFPSFMPHTPVSRLLNHSLWSSSGGSTQAATVAAQAAAAAVPHVNILAGAGDFSLPLTHAGAAGAPFGEQDGGLTLLMRDMPGVWATCSHKAIVSCNQLVRQLVPLVVDAAAMTVSDGAYSSLSERQAAVQALLQRRLATNAAAALGLQQGAEQGLEAESEVQARSACGSTEPAAAAAAAAGQQPAEAVTTSLLRRHVAPGSMLRLSWDGAQAAAAGWKGLLLLATAAPPCSHLSVLIQQAVADSSVSSSSSSRQLVGSAVPLPPLLPALQQRWVPRHWQEVMRGIDWQHNATRLLYVPFASGSTSGGRLPSIEVVVRGSSSGGSLLLAQALAAHPADAEPSLQLPPPGREIELTAGHAAVLRLRLPRRAWPLGRGACGPAWNQLANSLKCLAQLLLGNTPPWSLRIQHQHCSTGSNSGPDGGASLSPVVLAAETGDAAGDSVQLVGSAVPAFGGGSGSAVELWDGVGPVDQLWLVSDPSCAYSLRLEWDVGGWLGLALRHLLFILPPLCMAASQARLSPLPGSTARLAVAASLLAAWGSQHPAAVQAASRGLAPRPWVRLPAAEALAALVLAAGGSSACAVLTRASVRLLRRALPSKPGRRLRLLLDWLAPVAVAASCLLAPAIPAGLGCLCLAARLAVASSPPCSPDRTGAPSAPARALAWLVFYSQLALLPAVQLLGRVLGGGWRAAVAGAPTAWTDGRAAVAALALHASLLRCRGQGQQGAAPGAPQWRRLVAGVGHEAAACAGAVAALWGAPSFLLHGGVLSAALGSILAKKRL